MSDIILYTTLASSVLVILFIIALLRGKRGADPAEDDGSEVRASPVARRDVLAGAPVRRVGGRVVRGPRLQARRRPAHGEEDDEDDYRDGTGFAEEGDSDEGPAITVPTTLDDGTKIGAKKLRKLQEKAEKKAHRESELEEREERKKRQLALDEQKKKEAELEKLNEEKQKAEELRLKAEKEKEEYEEYLKLKAGFEVESEGFDDAAGEKDAKDLLKEFIDYIKTEKVVLLEDLAAKFNLKTQDAIDRVEALMSSGDLTGVIDDRGKVIYISRAELEAVAKFVKQRGRVQISELVECSNILIDMNPKKLVQ